MIIQRILSLSFLFFSAIISDVQASPLPLDHENTEVFKKVLMSAYPHAEIEIKAPLRWSTPQSIQEVKSVQLMGDDQRGVAHFSVENQVSGELAQVWVPFTAYVHAFVPNRRIRPGEILQPNQFSVEKINVAIAPAREYRGVILTSEVSLHELESTQTLLEGQFVSSTAVRKIPDVRRGENVQVHVKFGGVLLSTRAMVEEAAYLKQKVKVLTQKNKKELTGQLVSSGVVEVSL